MFRAGQRVRVTGLSSAGALNGRCGRAMSFVAAKGRYLVAVDGDDDWKLVKPSNLETVAGPSSQRVDGTPPIPGVLRFASFNLLAPANLEEHRHMLYSHSPPGALEPRPRLSRLVRTVLGLQADVIGLQEVDPDDYRHTWAPRLAERGYRGAFKQRTGGQADGVALFWREARLEAEAEPEAIEYVRLADEWAARGRAAEAEALRKHQAALLV